MTQSKEEKAAAEAEAAQVEQNAQIVDEAAHAVGRPGRARAEVFKGRDGWYVRLIADNGEETFVSEAHDNRGDAFTLAIESFPTLPIVDFEAVKAAEKA